MQFSIKFKKYICSLKGIYAGKLINDKSITCTGKYKIRIN